MHGKIFEVVREPISKEDFLDEADIWNDREFICKVDYVDGYIDDDERSMLIQDLAKYSLGESCAYDPETNCFTIISKKEYFKFKYEGFIEALTEAKDMTLEEFSNGSYVAHHAMREINDLYNTEYESYVYDSGGFWNGVTMTLDEFMRVMKNGDRFYIGAVIDYHF